MKEELKGLNALVKQMMGHRMTTEQLVFQDELRKKVKEKEITVEEGYRLWREKYGEE